VAYVISWHGRPAIGHRIWKNSGGTRWLKEIGGASVPLHHWENIIDSPTPSPTAGPAVSSAVPLPAEPATSLYRVDVSFPFPAVATAQTSLPPPREFAANWRKKSKPMNLIFATLRPICAIIEIYNATVPTAW
jgi:hypothetical protein